MQFLEQEEKKMGSVDSGSADRSRYAKLSTMIEDGQVVSSRGMARGRRGEEAHGGLELY
jgi:hypothetical protein